MCGIAGIVTNNRNLSERLPVLDEMLIRLSHRGPDGEGRVHHKNQALFGHRRLAVIDLERGQQPMCSSDGRYTIVYNGEIYNYVELRQELVKDGEFFFTTSDTEVLLKLMVREGVNCINRLNGMFAFLFHDKKNNSWVAARDNFGIKPFYYVKLKDEFVFSSEIKALLAHPDIIPYRDDGSLQQYLTFQFCLGEKTLFRGIDKLKPGFFMIGRGSDIVEERCYWDTDYNIDQYHTEEFFVDRLRYLLEDSIRIQMRSDVPVGCYLSGGIDSSVVSVLASNIASEPLSVFHGRFAEGEKYDESLYAKAVVESMSGIYHEVIPSALDFVDFLPNLIYTLDEPLAGPGLFPQFCVSRYAKEHVKVVLGGQGGDEIFGGYARYLIGYLEQTLKGAIFETQEEGKHLVTLESIIPNLSLLKQYHPLLSQFWSKGLFEPMDARYFSLINRIHDVSDLLMPDILNSFESRAVFTDFQKIFNHPDTHSYINKMTHFDLKTLLPALLHIEDRVSMSVSLESRVPFLDTRIVDLVTTMPPVFKFQSGRTKDILKKSVRTLLPDSVLERKDKMGFPVPIKEWMQQSPVRDFAGDVLLSRASKERGIFSSQALESMLCDYGVGDRRLWGALCLEIWHNRFIDLA